MRAPVLLPAWREVAGRTLARDREQAASRIASRHGANLDRDRRGEPVAPTCDIVEVAKGGSLVDPEQGLNAGILGARATGLPSLEVEQLLQAPLGRVVLEPMAGALEHHPGPSEGFPESM